MISAVPTSYHTTWIPKSQYSKQQVRAQISIVYLVNNILIHMIRKKRVIKLILVPCCRP